MRNAIRAAAVGALLLPAAGASAQTTFPGFSIERFTPDASAVSSFVIGTAEILPAGEVRVSASEEWELRPLIINGDGSVVGRGYPLAGERAGDVITDRATTFVSVAGAVNDWLELSARLPIIAWQQGQTGSSVLGPLSQEGIGPIDLGARVVAMKQDADSPLSIAFGLEVLPNWGSAQALGGDTAWDFAPRIEMSHRFDGFIVGAQANILVRPQPVYLPNSQTLGSEFQMGAVAATTGPGLRGELSIRGTPGQPPDQTMEILAGLRMPIGPFEAFVIGGPGFFAMPGTPTWRVVGGFAFNTRS